MMNSLAPKHQLWISVCTKKNMKKTQYWMDIESEHALYRKNIQGKAIYTKEEFFSWNEVGNILQLWRIQNDWQDQTCVTKHGSPDAHVLKMYHERQEYSTEKVL